MGYGNLVIALVGDGLPYALNLYIATASWPATVPGRYLVVNGALQLLSLSCLALPLQLRASNERLRRAARADAPSLGVTSSVSSRSHDGLGGGLGAFPPPRLHVQNSSGSDLVRPAHS